jgi:hypothetical protein
MRHQASVFEAAEEAWAKEAMLLSQSANRDKGRKNSIFLLKNPGVARKDTEELERQKANNALRHMLRGAADLAANSDDAYPQDDDSNNTVTSNVQTRARARLLLLLRRSNPLVQDIKRIEARYGTSVSAYFVFCRWVWLNYMRLAPICALSLIVHIDVLNSEVHLYRWRSIFIYRDTHIHIYLYIDRIYTFVCLT